MSEPDAETETKTEKTESAAEKGPKKVPHGKRRVKLPSTGDGESRWPMYVTAAIAVIAVAVAIGAWFRPAHSASAPHYSDQQTSEAKKSVCTAYNSAKQSVVINTHMANPRGDDPIGQLAVAANARLALLGGGQYLRQRLAAHPAAPADLSAAVTSLAKTIEDLGMGYLDGSSTLALDPLRADLNSEIGQLDAMCA
jgi:hypothetical protein